MITAAHNPAGSIIESSLTDHTLAEVNMAVRKAAVDGEGGSAAEGFELPPPVCAATEVCVQ